MASVWNDVINAALRNIHVIAPAEGASTSEQTDALFALNQLLGSLSAEGLPIPFRTLTPIPATGSESYSLAARPLKVEAVEVRTAAGVSKTARVVPVEEWAAWVDKTAAGQFAEIAYCDYVFPNSLLFLMPKVATGNTINVWAYAPLAAVADATAPINMPAGYERAITALLAIDLAPQFGAQVDQTLMLTAQSAKAAISGLNAAVLGAPTPVRPEPPQPVAPAPA